jgi:hypothetical protein
MSHRHDAKDRKSLPNLEPRVSENPPDQRPDLSAAPLDKHIGSAGVYPREETQFNYIVYRISFFPYKVYQFHHSEVKYDFSYSIRTQHRALRFHYFTERESSHRNKTPQLPATIRLSTLGQLEDIFGKQNRISIMASPPQRPQTPQGTQGLQGLYRVGTLPGFLPLSDEPSLLGSPRARRFEGFYPSRSSTNLVERRGLVRRASSVRNSEVVVGLGGGRTSQYDGGADEVEAEGEGARLGRMGSVSMEVLNSPVVRSMRLIGNSNPRYKW